MTKTFTHQLATGTSRTTGIAAQTLNTLCHFAGAEIDNSVNLDESADIELLFTLAATPVAGAPINVHILYAPDGTNYEDGIPATNDGTAAASPVPFPSSLVGSVGVAAASTAQRVTLRDIPLQPHKMKLVIYNGTTKSCTNLLTVKLWGKKRQTLL